MRPQVQTITGNGSGTQNTSPLVMDIHRNPFNVSIVVDTDGSTTTATVQYSLDNPFASYATDYGTNATWLNHADITASTDDADANFAFPVRAIRLQVGATGTDTWVMTVIQAGIVGA